MNAQGMVKHSSELKFGRSIQKFVMGTSIIWFQFNDNSIREWSFVLYLNSDFDFYFFNKVIALGY